MLSVQWQHYPLTPSSLNFVAVALDPAYNKFCYHENKATTSGFLCIKKIESNNVRFLAWCMSSVFTNVTTIRVTCECYTLFMPRKLNEFHLKLVLRFPKFPKYNKLESVCVVCVVVPLSVTASNLNPFSFLPFSIHFKMFLWELFVCPYSTNWHDNKKKTKTRGDESLS